MNGEPIRQRRDGTTLCTLPTGLNRAATFLPGADATSAAFAFAAAARPMLPRDDDAIAAAWTARTVRRIAGPDAVSDYDAHGSWTVPMDEAFAHGFVAFLRGAAWGAPWPPNIAGLRTQLASTMAACPDGAEGLAVAAGLDEPIRALFGRLVAQASSRGVLPFTAPVVAPQRPYGEPEPGSTDAAAAPAIRKASSTVGPAASGGSERPEPAIGFASLDQSSPRRFGVAVAVVVAGLLLAGVATVVLYFTALRPGRDDAARAAEATIEQLRNRQMARIYDGGAAVLRRERWPDFAARVTQPEQLGKLLDARASEPPRIERIPGVGRTAHVTYDATYVFGTASIGCRYVDVGFSGEWRLAELDVTVRPDVTEPPYPATPEGADLMARRILYAFQNHEYDAIDEILPSPEGQDRAVQFRNTLIGDGYITKVERTSLADGMVGPLPVQVATYTIETSREQRSGTLALKLVRNGGSWKAVAFETLMSFRR